MTPDIYRAINYALHDFPLRSHDVLRLVEEGIELQSAIDQVLSRYNIKPETRERARKRLSDYRSGVLYSQLAANKIEVVTPVESGYPSILKELDDYPLALYFKGNLDCLKQPMIAMVGSRKCSEYGRKMATRFAELLSPYFTVVSGMAEGIDTAAHHGAISAHSATISVMGTGLDQIFPSKNSPLFHQIVACGLAISEYPPEVGIQSNRFPQRNRLIAGLSQGAVVIEAAGRSGALITARLAAEQGREIFVIPGQIDTPYSIGSHQLIQDGAKLVTCLPDILREFAHLEVRNLGPSEKPDSDIWEFVSESETQIISVLKQGECSVDDLIEATGLSIVQVMRGITTLQEKRLIKENPGQKYSAEIDLQSHL